MFPLLPFALGVAAGVTGVRVLRKQKIALPDTGKVRDELRGAAVSGLSAIESSAAKLRGRLEPTSQEPASPEASA